MIGRTLNTVLKNLFEGGVPVIVVLLVMLGSFRAGLIRAMAIPGAADVKADYQANLTTVTIVPDRAALARYGIEAQQVMDVVEALGGCEVGIIFEGRARFPIRVRIPDNWRSEIDRLKQLPVAEAGGKPVPLDELAEGQCSRASAKTANAIAGSNA